MYIFLENIRGDHSFKEILRFQKKKKIAKSIDPNDSPKKKSFVFHFREKWIVDKIIIVGKYSIFELKFLNQIRYIPVLSKRKLKFIDGSSFFQFIYFESTPNFSF